MEANTPPNFALKTDRDDLDLPAEQVVVAYHERTKHHYHRYAASLGYMDWAKQPDPFRRYDGAPLVRLPFPDGGRALPYWRLYVPDNMAPAPLSVDSISLFLRYAFSLTAWKRFEGTTWSLRANPSSGNLHPTEGYVLLPSLDAIHIVPILLLANAQCFRQRDTYTQYDIGLDLLGVPHQEHVLSMSDQHVDSSRCRLSGEQEETHSCTTVLPCRLDLNTSFRQRIAGIFLRLDHELLAGSSAVGTKLNHQITDLAVFDQSGRCPRPACYISRLLGFLFHKFGSDSLEVVSVLG